MINHWEQTSEISMTVQSAEMHIPSLSGGRHLLLSCRLVNIARGNCRLEVHPTHDNEPKENMLHIPMDRPVMQGVLQFMERTGLEPVTPALQRQCSPN